MFVVVSYDIRSHVPLTCFHHYLLVFAMFIYLFLASSHQLYAELWLDFLSLAGFYVTLEMTSRVARPVPDSDLTATGYLHPPRSTYPLGWAFSLSHFLYSVHFWVVLLLPRVRHALLSVHSHSVLYLMMDWYLFGT